MTIRTIEEAQTALQAYVPNIGVLTPKDTTLERIGPLMARLENPQDQMKIVHLAGTSGKTSTAYYMAALLHAAGRRVGLTVSPHVDSITERIQIDGRPVSDTVFCTELEAFLEPVEAGNEQPSYFELLYAFALWVMARQRVEYAVVETGVGGLHDATNVATRPDKVCIITDIGFDHMQLLGNTLPEIAAQKIGIVHTGNQVFCYRQSDEIMRVFESYTAKQGGTLHITTEADERQRTQVNDDLPAYQQRNWLLAYACYRYLAGRDRLPSLTSEVLQATQTVRIPGRMETVRVKNRTVVMDGAHNPAKMTAFVTSFQQLHPGVKPIVLLALKSDKDYAKLVPIVGPFAERIITTAFNTTQDLPVRSMDPAKLATAFLSQGFQAEAIADQKAAVRAMLDDPNPVGVITGSFYLLSQIRGSKLVA